jgi:hypothetical protein
MAHALVSQEAEPIGHVPVVRRYEPSFPGRQVLRRVERKAPYAERAHRLAANRSSVCLRGVLNHRDPAIHGDCSDSVHVRRIAVKVHRDDGGRPGCDGGFERRRVDREVLENIDEASGGADL